MGRGIYLVANLKSQSFCENLIYSVRSSGCTLPIRLIHFGGEKVNSKAILNEVEFLEYADFSAEARHFITRVKTVITHCPEGFLYRFLPWFSDWDEFVYSDNDVVALTNWEKLFIFPGCYHVVHADEEYTTGGKYSFNNPAEVTNLFGSEALGKAVTAGHFMARINAGMVKDMEKAVDWFKLHPGIARLHDQAFLHIAALIGNWNMLNLCKPPHNWLSSWAGDYANSLAVIQAIQKNGGASISHLHYSGGSPLGLKSIEHLLLSNKTSGVVLKKNMLTAIKFCSGYFYAVKVRKKIKRKLNSIFKNRIK